MNNFYIHVKGGLVGRRKEWNEKPADVFTASGFFKTIMVLERSILSASGKPCKAD